VGLSGVHASFLTELPRPRPTRGAVIEVAEVASAPVPDLGLDESGRPTSPVVVVDLDSAEAAAPAEIEAAAQRLAATLCVVLGVSRDVPPPSASSLLTVAASALAAQSADARVVVVADPVATTADLVEVVRRTPVAAATLVGVLRQTAELGVPDGLAAESAAYSTLLGGTEFAAWLAARGPARTVAADGPPVLVERQGDVLRVRLNRPVRRNAIDAGMRDALVDALAVAVADPEVAIELSGAGPAFSSGGDLDEFGSAPDPATAHLVRSEQSVGRLLDRVRDRATAFVHGPCIGAGVEIPAFAGRVVARRDATFRLPELALGLIPGAGGTVSVPRRIGRWRAAWMALAGADVDAETALRWGLVDAVEDFDADLHRETKDQGTD